MRARVLLAVLVLSVLCGVGISQATPVRDGTVRAVILLCAAASVASFIALTWSRMHLGKAASALLIGLLLWAVVTLPPAPVDRAVFVDRIVAREGVPYVWGGETDRGLDCSGLIRLALMETYLRGLRPGAALRIWLADASAKELPRRCRGVFGEPVEYASIESADHRRIGAGAIAVTSSGVHVLCHVGDGWWAQASSEAGEVTVSRFDSGDRWFLAPVRVHPLAGSP